MTSYFSLLYLLVFLPAVTLLYQILPQKHRWKVLLGASYLFFWSVSGKLLLFLVFSTCSIHYFGLWMSIVQNERDRLLSEAEKQSKKSIKEKYQKPGNVYIGLVHRLDRPVGGVMVFARTSKAASRAVRTDEM